MKAYLFWHKRIAFQLTDGLSFFHGGKKKGEVEIMLASRDLTAYSGGDASQNWSVLSKLKDLESSAKAVKEKSLKITFTDLILQVSATTQMSVRIEGELLQEIRNVLGSGVRVKLEILKAQVGKPVPFNFSTPFTVARPTFFGSASATQSGQSGGIFGGGNAINGASGGGIFSSSTTSTPTFGLGLGQCSYASSLWQSCEMVLTPTTLGNESKSAFCEDTIVFPGDWKEHWITASSEDDDDDDTMFTAEINVIVSVVSPLVPGSDKTGFSGWSWSTDAAQINKRLLQEELRSDVEIIAANGNAVKCHSAFLAVHSEVLKTMLDSGMEESKTNKISMSDVSEEGVRALLAYLYYRDVAKPNLSSSVATELLQVGHKYLVGCLEDAMKSILLDKPETWFDGDSALRLFYFAGKLEVHGDLKLKAVQVCKSKPSAVLASEEYQRLFEVDEDDDAESGDGNGNGGWNQHRAQLQAAKELCNALLSSTAVASSAPAPNNNGVLLNARRRLQPKK